MMAYPDACDSHMHVFEDSYPQRAAAVGINTDLQAIGRFRPVAAGGLCIVQWGGCAQDFQAVVVLETPRPGE